MPDSHVSTSYQGHVPTVSIGMPVFNGEGRIRTALDSLLAQTYRDFEVVVSDNASTDSTEAICREYAAGDSRIRYFRQAEGCPATSNFEAVLREAQGKFFMWAAHDDRWMPTYIAATLQMLGEHPGAVCAVSQVRFSDGNLSRATFSITGSPRQRLRAYLSHPSDNARIYGLYRIAALRQCLRSLRWNCFAGDWILVAAVAIEGDILEVPEVLMERQVAEKGTYFSSLSRKSLLVSTLPLLPFTLQVLKHKEAWTVGSLRRLFALNIRYHVDMAKHCGWFTYPGYRAVSRAIRKLRAIVPVNHGSGGPA